MSHIRVNLSKEEKEEFAKLTEQEQKQFLDDALAMRHTLMVKTAVVSMILIESFDDLKEFGLQRQRLKNLGNQYNKELEKYINAIFDSTEEKGNAADYVALMSGKVDNLFRNKTPELDALVDLVWLVEKGALKNEIVERINKVKEQFNIKFEEDE